MAFDEQQIKLILDMGNSGQNVQEVARELEKLEKQAKETSQGYEVLERSTGTYALATNQVSTALDAEERQLKQVWAALEETYISTTKLSNAVDGPTKGSKGMGQAAMSASYAFQDFTSQLGTSGLAGTLRAVQNNIPGILSGTALTGTWIAGISAAAVAVGLLVDAWSDWNKELEKDRLEKAKKDMDELMKKTVEFQAMVEKGTKGEEAGAKVIAEAISEGGEEKIQRTLTRELVRQGKGVVDPMVAAQQGQVQMVAGTRFEATERAVLAQVMAQPDVQAREREANMKKISDAMVDIGKGGAAGARARGLLGPLIAAGPEGLPMGFQGAFERSDPAEMKRQQELETQGALNIDNMARHDKAAKEKEAADKRVKHEVDRRKAEKARNEEQGQRDIEHWENVFKRQEEQERDAGLNAEQAGVTGVAALERIAKQGKRKAARGEAHQQREAQKQMQRQHHEQEDINADIERVRNENNRLAIESAQARGATRQVLEMMREQAHRERLQNAEERRFHSRQMRREEQTTFGGGQN